MFNFAVVAYGLCPFSSTVGIIISWSNRVGWDSILLVESDRFGSKIWRVASGHRKWTRGPRTSLTILGSPLTGHGPGPKVSGRSVSQPKTYQCQAQVTPGGLAMHSVGPAHRLLAVLGRLSPRSTSSFRSEMIRNTKVF